MRELLQRVDAAELTEWQILEGIEPWGQTAVNFMLANVCCTIANHSMNRGNGPGAQPKNYLPKPVEPPTEYADADSIMNLFMGMAQKQKKK